MVKFVNEKCEEHSLKVLCTASDGPWLFYLTEQNRKERELYLNTF